MGYDLSEIVILDIETTGFHRTYDVMSVLGLIYFEKQHDSINGYIVQLFNENGSEDAQIISRLKHYLKSCNLLITYNGDRFDIPFLLEKTRLHAVDNHPLLKIDQTMTSLDLYKVSKLQFPFLKKCTLKAVEEQLEIHRDDLISGKEAAQSYRQFLRTKDFEMCKPILEHNYEDILNLIPLFYKLYHFSNTTLAESSLLFPLSIPHGRVTQMHFKDNLLVLKGSFLKQPDLINMPDLSLKLLSDPVFNQSISHCDYTVDLEARQLIIRLKCVHAPPYILVDLLNSMLPLSHLNGEQLDSLIISTNLELNPLRIKLMAHDLFELLFTKHFLES